METDGYGSFSSRKEGEEKFWVCFGSVEMRGESYDIALVLLASALLDDQGLCRPFFERMRAPKMSPPKGRVRGKGLRSH